ncbi:hypothetical protein CT399_002313 [Salmonella enterica subsp. enterica serovar Saintpaul]|nr:hypothetical protein [Salmonella enterica subsp. enterica serovar Saintpaul]
MENNNRFMPHIRRTTHIMMFAHRNSFDFHFLMPGSFSATGTSAYRSFRPLCHSGLLPK